jgi:hypothetical protein
MLPKEKDDDRLLASAVMLLQIAACAPTTEMGFQSENCTHALVDSLTPLSLNCISF